jgi:hypothetical protein
VGALVGADLVIKADFDPMTGKYHDLGIVFLSFFSIRFNFFCSFIICDFDSFRWRWHCVGYQHPRKQRGRKVQISQVLHIGRSEESPAAGTWCQRIRFGCFWWGFCSLDGFYSVFVCFLFSSEILRARSVLRWICEHISYQFARPANDQSNESNQSLSPAMAIVQNTKNVLGSLSIF